MTSAARRQFSVLIAAVAVLVGAAGFAPAGAVAPLAGPATVAVSAGGPGLQAAGLLDTRVQRSGATEERDPSSRPHGYAAPAGPGRCPQAWAPVPVHGVTLDERPAPGRQICLRGPPGSSV